MVRRTYAFDWSGSVEQEKRRVLSKTLVWPNMSQGPEDGGIAMAHKQAEHCTQEMESTKHCLASNIQHRLDKDGSPWFRVW